MFRPLAYQNYTPDQFSKIFAECAAIGMSIWGHHTTVRQYIEHPQTCETVPGKFTMTSLPFLEALTVAIEGNYRNMQNQLKSCVLLVTHAGSYEAIDMDETGSITACAATLADPSAQAAKYSLDIFADQTRDAILMSDLIVGAINHPGFSSHFHGQAVGSRMDIIKTACDRLIHAGQNVEMEMGLAHQEDLASTYQRTLLLHYPEHVDGDIDLEKHFMAAAVSERNLLSAYAELLEFTVPLFGQQVPFTKAFIEKYPGMVKILQATGYTMERAP